jgi:hypothetical protein
MVTKGWELVVGRLSMVIREGGNDAEGPRFFQRLR